VFVAESSQYPEFHTCNSETVTFRDSGSDTDGFLSPDTGDDNFFKKVRERNNRLQSVICHIGHFVVRFFLFFIFVSRYVLAVSYIYRFS